MIRTLKKIAGALLVAQILILGTSATVLASSAVITLTDLRTEVGEIVTINCRIDGRGTNLSNAKIEMSYDADYIQLISGDDIDASESGKLVYEGSGSGDILRFSMEIQALKEGQVRIRLDKATVTAASGTQLEVELGYSDINIDAGDPSNIVESPMATGESVSEIAIAGTVYSLMEDFRDSDLPRGFDRGTIVYEGTNLQGAVQKNGTMQLAYLVNSATQESGFYIYESDELFTPFEQILISSESYIILLQKDENINVPQGFEEVNLTMNNHNFQAWQETKDLDFYLVYAQNESGEQGFYRYDSKEQTYQRYAMEGSALLEGDVVEDENANTQNSGWLGTVLDYMASHVEQVLIAFVLLMVLFIVLLIIIGVKLHNRNLELDEFYDEYELDMEIENDVEEKSEKKLKPAPKPAVEERFEDDFDFDEEFDFDEDDVRPKKKASKKPAKKPAKKSGHRPVNKSRKSHTDNIGLEFIDLD